MNHLIIQIISLEKYAIENMKFSLKLTSIQCFAIEIYNMMNKLVSRSSMQARSQEFVMRG